MDFEAQTAIALYQPTIDSQADLGLASREKSLILQSDPLQR